jgi:hypothetical protein
MNPKIFFGELKRRNVTAYAARDSGLSQLAVTPFFLPCMNDPRFVALCRKFQVQLPSALAKP